MSSRSILTLVLFLTLLPACAAHRGSTAPAPQPSVSTPPQKVDLGGLVIRMGEDPVTGLDTYDGDELFALGLEAYGKGDYEVSRYIYAHMIDVFPEHPDTLPGKWNHGLSLEKLGRIPEAIDAFADYLHGIVATGSDPSEAARARLRLATLLQREGRYEELATVLDAADRFEGYEDFEIWELRALRAIAKGAEGSFLTAESELNRIRSEIKRTTRATEERFPYQAAMVWYLAGTLDRLHASAIVLDSVDDLEKLDKDIGRKADLLLEARRRFKRAIEHNEPTWSGPAAFSLGGVYEDFRRDMLAAPAPTDLDEEAEAVYSRLLSERTRQFLEAAVKDYRAVLELASSMQLEEPWIEAVSSALARCEEELAAAAPAAGD